MNERSVRIAISIHDRVTQQLACTMFSTAGAAVQVCENLAAILEVAGTIQACVFSLDSSPEETFDAIIALRKQSATLPLYVITDATGQRHAKRATQCGATQVITNEQLQRRAGFLVQELAQRSGIQDWGIRSPGWAPSKEDAGYDIESMDMGTWLSIPGNRRLLGLDEEPETAQSTAATPPARDTVPVVDGPSTEPSPASASSAEPDVPTSSAFGIAAAPAAGAPDINCPQVLQCRAQHDAQNIAILDAHKQREKRFHADIRNELTKAMTRQLAASEAKLQEQFDASVAQVRQDVAATLRRVNLMTGILAGVVVLILLGAVGVVGDVVRGAVGH